LITSERKRDMDFKHARLIKLEAYMTIRDDPELWNTWHLCKTEEERTAMLIYVAHTMPKKEAA
jgi:hypothetical protein